MAAFFRRTEDPARWFGKEEREAILAAARRAESGHAAEIVPFVVGHCSTGPEEAWGFAVVGALAGSGMAALLAGGNDHGWPLALWILVPPFLGTCLGWLLAWGWPALGCRFLPVAVIDQRVLNRAKLAFLDESVFRTRDRSGMLLFVALRERRALLLADEGISALVAQEEWKDIVEGLVAAIASGHPAAGLVSAIEACGLLLQRHGPQARPDDRDELGDELRLHER